MIRYLLLPPVFFCLVWFVVTLLHSLKLSYILIDLNAATIYLLLGTMLCFLMGFFYFYLFNKGVVNIGVNKEKYISEILSKKVAKRFKYAFIFWAFFSLLEVIYHKNVPFLSAFGIGSYIRYTNFGFPGIHGFLNALYFSVICYFFISNILAPSKRKLILILIMFIWPFLLLHRMIIVALFIQLLLIYVIFNQDSIKFKKIIGITVVFLLFILVFGYLGDLRSGREHLLRLAKLNFEYPDWLPSGFIWIYLYITTPINNLINSVDFLVYPDPLPIELISRVFPSVIREYVLTALGKELEFELVSSAFNVSTFYVPILRDLGYVFAPFLFLFLGFISSYIVHISYSKPRYLIAWVAFMYSIVISIFSNHMFHLVFWFEAIFFYILIRGVKPI